MSTFLPRDDGDLPIPVLRFKPDGAHVLSVSSTSARVAVPFAAATRVIGIYATGPVFLRTGDATVTAATSDHFFPEGFYYDLSLGDRRQGRHNYLAAIRADTDCLLYISEKE